MTRLYDPEAFGLFGIFYAIICVLGILATWRLKMAIMLPQDDKEARQLWKGTFPLLSGNSSLFGFCAHSIPLVNPNLSHRSGLS